MKVLVESKGHILGFGLSRDKKSLIFNAGGVGLQRYDLSSGKLETIFDSINGVKLNTFAGNSYAETSNGDFYFTVSMDNYVMKDYIKNTVRARPHGSLYFYDSQTQTHTQICDGLYFANGVVLEEGEQSVLVAETIMYRVTRVWVSGPKKGKKEPFIENLPGNTDNIKINDNKELWVAIPAFRSLLSEIGFNTKFMRNVLVYFDMEWVLEKFADFRYAGGFKVDTKTGKIVQEVFGKAKYTYCTTTLL